MGASLRDLVIIKIFKPNGLYDQLRTFEAARKKALLEYIKASKYFEMNLKAPKNNYDHIKKYTSVKGVSDDLANFSDLRVQDKEKVTLDQIDVNIDHFQMFSDVIKMDTSMYT